MNCKCTAPGAGIFGSYVGNADTYARFEPVPEVSQFLYTDGGNAERGVGCFANSRVDRLLGYDSSHPAEGKFRTCRRDVARQFTAVNNVLANGVGIDMITINYPRIGRCTF